MCFENAFSMPHNDLIVHVIESLIDRASGTADYGNSLSCLLD